METKFTKGEWRVTNKYPGLIAICCNDKKRTICTILEGGLMEETKANAKLIAAAPKMFKTLVDAWHVYKNNEFKNVVEIALGFKLTDLELMEIYNKLNTIKKVTE